LKEIKMTNQTLSQQATTIANLGQWLQQNVDGVLQEPKINKICQEWNITRKVFDRVFYNYIAVGKKERNPRSIQVVDVVTGERFNSITEATKARGLNITTTKRRLACGEYAGLVYG
jgi:hypothetical protein